MKLMISLTVASVAGVLLFGYSSAPHLGMAASLGSGCGTAQTDLTPRGLYISKIADAMLVKVMDVKSDAPVSPTQQFTTDDRLKLVIASNFQGYAYIVNVEISKSGEKRFMLYPNPQQVNNRIKPDEPLQLLVAFDEKPATEFLQVIVSHDPIDYLSAALNSKCSEAENRCLLDAQTAPRVAALVGDNNSRRTETPGIFPKQSVRGQNQSGLQSRDIILAPGKDPDDRNETYVAIPLKAGNDGRLKAKEVVVFECRLKHV
jgi:hypothetical protein